MRYKYGKYTGDPLDELDLDDLIEKLSDLLLSSGFQSPYGGMYGESEDDRTLQALHDAIMDALFNGGVLPEDALERLLGDPADGDQADARSKLEQLIQDIIDRMMQEGFISPAPDLEPEKAHRQSPGTGGRFGPDSPPTRFEVTERAWTFSATAPFAICWARSARAASAGTTPATTQPESKPSLRPSPMSLETR